jgi:chromate reductase
MSSSDVSSARPRLLGISGSLRAGAYTTAILEGLRAPLADKADYEVFRLNEVPLYDGDLDTPNPPAGVAALRAAIAAADGLIVASPEYNYGMSGVLKNAIDWASRPGGKGAIKGKPALIITSSPGTAGGVRAQYQVREALSGAGARPIVRPHVAIAQVGGKIEHGKLTEKEALDFTLAAVDGLIEEIHILALHKARA